MAFSGGPVSAEQVEMVAMVTGFEDRPMITNALQGNHGNVETVINEYLDDASKVGPSKPTPRPHPSLRWPSSCLLTPSHRSSSESMAGMRPHSPQSAKARALRRTTPPSLVGTLLRGTLRVRSI